MVLIWYLLNNTTYVGVVVAVVGADIALGKRIKTVVRKNNSTFFEGKL
jgi:hypothetical protein